ncbi:hypothetical protein ACVWXN_007986 [Bradyrhizobium sp. i1.4.4]
MPGSGHLEKATRPPVIWTFSSMTTASTSGGTGAPVSKRTTSPRPGCADHGAPANVTPAWRKAVSGAVSISSLRMPYPSTALWSNGGSGMDAATSAAAMRPTLRPIGTISTSATGLTVASATASASSMPSRSGPEQISCVASM